MSRTVYLWLCFLTFVPAMVLYREALVWLQDNVGSWLLGLIFAGLMLTGAVLHIRETRSRPE
jgi:hypothetical protein